MVRHAADETAAILAAVRHRLAVSLRSRVAGADASERAAQIWGSPGPRRFRPGDPIWQVHADASMYVGGIRALLLQSLHPLAMAGVAGHSGFRSDPWGRLQRTSAYIATTTFGTTPHADDLVARVRSVHDRVRGKAEDGRSYAASDPHLLGWVHAAEIGSFLRAYQLYGPGPLSSGEADRYVEQTAVIAELVGVVGPPRSVADLRRVLDGYRAELEPTPASRDAARFLVLRPPLPLAARPGYTLLCAGALASLPAWARTMVGLPLPTLVAAGIARPAGRVAAGVVRWAMGDRLIAADRVSAPQP